MIAKNKYYIIGFILLSSINFWSFLGNTLNGAFKLLQIAIIIYMCMYLVMSRDTPETMYSRRFVLAFILIPFLAIFPCYFVHGQSFLLSAFVLRINLCWFFYFLLHYFKISERDLIRLVILIATIWVAIEIIQQITYPKYLFFVRGEDADRIEIRNGIYRYSVAGFQFGLLSLFYYMQKYYDTKKMKNIVLALFFLLGIYLLMTRQILFAALLCLLIAPILNKRSFKNSFFFILSILVLYLVYHFRYVLFGDLIRTTTNELDDNIRYHTYAFFLTYWEDWSCFVFGNGLSHESSQLGQYLHFIGRNYGYWIADIGIVGELHKFGVFYVICYLFLCFNILWSLRKKIDMYLRLYFISALIMTPMIFPFRDGSEFIIFSMFLYLCDLSIIKNTQLLTK